MNIKGNLSKLSIDNIREAETAINSQRDLCLDLAASGRVKVNKLTRGQSREIIQRLNTDQIQALLSGIEKQEGETDADVAQRLVNTLIGEADELLDRILDYGSNFPGGAVAEGSAWPGRIGDPVRDHLPLEEQLLTAAAVIVLNITGNKAVAVFSQGVGDAGQPESPNLTVATSPEPAGSAV